MWQLLKDAISGAAAFFRWKDKQWEQLNTPEMQSNARAQANAKIRDAATQAVAKDDIDEIRRRAAE